MQAAAEELDRGGAMPFAGFVTDPCDGRTQGTLGHDGQPAYRNDAAHGVPPADPLAAHAPRRDGRGDLRQGPAGDDDGAGGARDLPVCSCPAA